MEDMVAAPRFETLPTPGYWAGKRVLLTGHTGFKGAWLALWLRRLGAEVIGVSLTPETTPNLFDAALVADRITESHFLDIRDASGLAAIVQRSQPEVVFHLAAQALVLAGYDDPLGTISVNVSGTANVLDVVRTCDSVRTVVAITTDKVYENREEAYPFRETDRLGGHDPYSASKAAAELVISCYRSSFLAQRGIAVAAARAGNVIGGGDWADNRLIPDAVRAWGRGIPLVVRNPASRRPWQHVLEPLAAYLYLAERLGHDPELAGSYNFGPLPHEAANVREVISLARKAFGRGRIDWGTVSVGTHEAKWLALETSKARNVLGIEPRWPLRDCVERTMAWYRRYIEGEDAVLLCEEDISAFVNKVA
jgi:CDP-glucose 4,6-dehydratase